MLTEQQRRQLAMRLIHMAQVHFYDAIQAILRRNLWDTLEALAAAKACLQEANHWWQFKECFHITDLLQQIIEDGCQDWRRTWILCFDFPTDIKLPEPKTPDHVSEECHDVDGSP